MTQKSTNKILSSHSGVLPRPADLQALVDPSHAAEFDKRITSAIAEVVQKQIEVGMDIVNDGEYIKRTGFGGYIRERLQGIESKPNPNAGGAKAWGSNRTGARDQDEFPGFHEAHKNNSSVTGSFYRTPDGGGWAPGPTSPAGQGMQSVVTSPLKYVGQEAIAADIKAIQDALKGKSQPGFIASLGPGTMRASLVNEAYKDDEAFLFGVADALHDEYKAITDAGLILQIDEPELARAFQFYPQMTIAEYRDYTALRIAAINKAVEGLPAENIRLHFCWGSGHRPHKNDAELKNFMDVVLEAKVGCVAYEASNNRHAHEWKVWETLKLPAGMSIMPGVVGHASDIIEHPELVAERLIHFGELVGPENVLAGTDCGLGTRNGHAEITWAKLAAMSEGAAIASKKLFA